MSATSRPPDSGDGPAMHQLIAAIESHENQPYVTSLDETVELLHDDENPSAENVRVWVAPDGQPIGWAKVKHSPSGHRLERAILVGGVHPDHRGQGLGREILQWQAGRARERLAATPDHLEAIAITERYRGQDDKDALFAANGFAVTRYFDELQRPLADLPPIPALDEVTIVAWAPEHNDEARLVSNSAFADHWGSPPRSAETWKHEGLESFGRRLDLSFQAFVGDELVGYCLNGHYPEDESVTGRLDGWIDSLGTLASHRRKGIATALIVHSLHAFAVAGFNSSMLGVDSDSPTGAYGIYEALGYRRLHQLVAHTLTVRP